MASRSTASTRIPPKTAPPQATKSQVSTRADPYSKFVAPPPPRSHTAVNPKNKCSTYEHELHSQDIEAYKKAQIRAKRSTDPTNPVRLMEYGKHRERVRTAIALVDSSCPIVPKALYVNSAKFNRQIANFSRIERENAILLRRIAAVLEGNGSVDNRLKPNIRNRNNRARARQHTLLQMTFANLALVKRIQEQKPMYSRKEQLKDYAEHEKIMAEMSLYPLFWKVKKPEDLEECQLQSCDNPLIIPKPLFCVDYANEPGVDFSQILMEVRAGRAGPAPKTPGRTMSSR